MSRIVVNGRVQDLAASEKQNKVVPGCGDSEQQDQGATGPSERTIPEARVAKPKKVKGTTEQYYFAEIKIL